MTTASATGLPAVRGPHHTGEAAGTARQQHVVRHRLPLHDDCRGLRPAALRGGDEDVRARARRVHAVRPVAPRDRPPELLPAERDQRHRGPRPPTDRPREHGPGGNPDPCDRSSAAPWTVAPSRTGPTTATSALTDDSAATGSATTAPRPSALVGALSGSSLRREGMGVRAAHWPHVLPPQNLPRVPPRDRRRRRAVRAPRPARRPRARRTHLLPWLPAPRPPRPRAAVPGRLHGSGVPGSTPLVLSPYRRRPRSTGAPARSRGTRPVPGCPP